MISDINQMATTTHLKKQYRYQMTEQELGQMLTILTKMKTLMLTVTLLSSAQKAVTIHSLMNMIS